MVAHVEACETCHTQIYGVRYHRRGTFTDLCFAHYEQLAEEERTTYDKIESTPSFRPRRPWPPSARVFARSTGAVTRDDIVWALEKKTWAELSELPVLDWDLRVGFGEHLAWAGLLEAICTAIEKGVPTGLRLECGRRCKGAGNEEVPDCRCRDGDECSGPHYFGDKGACALSDALPLTASLTTLDLASVAISAALPAFG